MTFQAEEVLRMKVLSQERVGCLLETKKSHSPGKEKISGWKVSNDQTVQGLEGHGELCRPCAKPVGSPEVWGV